MASGWDDAELRRFTAEVASAAGRLAPEVRGVISKGALNVKKQMQAEMGASTHFKGVAASISYDLLGNAFFTEAQIGPVTGPGGVPGDLAHIAYFGGSRGGGGTVPDPKGALEVESRKVEKYLGDLLGGIL